jgi:hypothetical protein
MTPSDTESRREKYRRVLMTSRGTRTHCWMVTKNVTMLLYHRLPSVSPCRSSCCGHWYQQENAYIRGQSSNLHDTQYEIAKSNGNSISYAIDRQENSLTTKNTVHGPEGWQDCRCDHDQILQSERVFASYEHASRGLVRQGREIEAQYTDLGCRQKRTPWGPRASYRLPPRKIRILELNIEGS